MGDDDHQSSGSADASSPEQVSTARDDLSEHGQELIERILDPRGRSVIFLFGAALTMPCSGQPGVPGVRGMVAKIRDALGSLAGDDFVKAVQDRDYGAAYRTGFAKLFRVRGADAVNQVIREAVLEAHEALDDGRRERTLARHPNDHRTQCEALLDMLEGWHPLRPSLAALGEILSVPSSRFGKVLTTNFDPLIEIATRRAGGQVHRTVLPRDGSPGQHGGVGAHVVYLHGYWFGTDTLHTDVQLGNHRPQLEATLRRWLESSLLVVLGYGGWDDVLMRSLRAIVADDGAFPEIAWGFYGAKDGQAEANVVAKLADAGERVQFYEYVDLHLLLPRLRDRLRDGDPPQAIQAMPIASRSGAIGEPHLELQARVISMIREGIRRKGAEFLMRVRTPDKALVDLVVQRLRERRFPCEITEEDARWALGEASSVLATPPSVHLVIRRECPECGALPGEACSPVLHLGRIMATCRELRQPPPSYLSTEHVQSLTSCPKCGADVGEPCIGRRRTRKSNHQRRRELAFETARKKIYAQH